MKKVEAQALLEPFNFLLLHLKAKYKAYSYFVILTIQNDHKFTSGKIKRVQSRADNYNAYHKLAVAVAEVCVSAISCMSVSLLVGVLPY